MELLFVGLLLGGLAGGMVGWVYGQSISRLDSRVQKERDIYLDMLYRIASVTDEL